MIDRIPLDLNPLIIAHLFVAKAARTAVTAVVVDTVGGVGICCVSGC